MKNFNFLKVRYSRSRSISRYLPYPLRAARITIDINVFGFWWRPDFHHFHLTEAAKAAGKAHWYFRWAWFQISYARWL